VGEQEAIWVGGSTGRAGRYTYLYGKENENHKLNSISLCIREPYQQFAGLSLSVTECHTKY
jgi:hypothetical protein